MSQALHESLGEKKGERALETTTGFRVCIGCVWFWALYALSCSVRHAKKA